ncbi:hypothetical protein CHUAL_013690 [Chamberlinius hualienensis]
MMKQAHVCLWLLIAITLPVNYCMPEGYGVDSFAGLPPSAVKTDTETSTGNYNGNGAPGARYEVGESNGNSYGQEVAKVNGGLNRNYESDVSGNKDSSNYQGAPNPIESNKYNEGKIQQSNINGGAAYESGSSYQGAVNNNQPLESEKYRESDSYNGDRKQTEFVNSGYEGGANFDQGKYANKPFSSAADALKEFYNNFDGYNYKFGYNIEDNVYNNYQSRYESGNMDPKGQVTGSYTVMDPDGNVRNVEYVADRVTGFRATIRDRNGVTQHGYNSGSDDDGSYKGDSSSENYDKANQAQSGAQDYGNGKESQNAAGKYDGSTGGNQFSVSNGDGYTAKSAPVYNTAANIDVGATPNYAEQNAANSQQNGEGYGSGQNGFGAAINEEVQGYGQQNLHGIGNNNAYNGPNPAGNKNSENYNEKQSEGFGYNAPQFSQVSNGKASYEIKTNENAPIQQDNYESQRNYGQQQSFGEAHNGGSEGKKAIGGYGDSQSATANFQGARNQKESYEKAQDQYAAVQAPKVNYNGPQAEAGNYGKSIDNKPQSGAENFGVPNEAENYANTSPRSYENVNGKSKSGVYQATLRPTNVDNLDDKGRYANNGELQAQNIKPNEGQSQTGDHYRSSNGAAVYGNQFEEDEKLQSYTK